MLRFELLCAWWLPGRGDTFLAAAERGDEIFWRKCELTGTSRIKAAGIRQFAVNEARRQRMAALTAAVCHYCGGRPWRRRSKLYEKDAGN